jgi:phosphatidylinositol-3-phosphatase
MTGGLSSPSRPGARESSRRSRVLFALLGLLFAIPACSNQGDRPGLRPSRSLGGGSHPSPSTISPTSDPGHVVMIVMENKEYSSVIGSTRAPYMNSLANTFALAKAYHANAHPSLPDYLDLIAGQDFGIHDDKDSHLFHAQSLVDQLEAAGLTWRAYFEGLPADGEAPCPFPSVGSGYQKKHNPFAYFANVQGRTSRCLNIVPFSGATDLPNDLPNFTWIGPNLCHAMHDCSIETGDAWLAATVPAILRRLSGHDLLFVVFDEGTSRAGGGGHVACIVAGPGARAGASSTMAFTHFSLLKTIEERFGLEYLAHAGDPSVTDMSSLLR